MRSHTKRYTSRWCVLFVGLLAAAVVATPEAAAKGPPVPESDFVIVAEKEEGLATNPLGSWDSTGAVADTGLFRTVDAWKNADGAWWRRYRFQSDAPDSGCFDAVLPISPDRHTEYAVVLVAGPDGYLNGQDLHEGEWAVGTATARIRKESERRWHYWEERWFIYHYEVVEWTVSGFLLP